MPIPGAAPCAAALAQLGAGRQASDAAQGAPGAFNGFKFLLPSPSQTVISFNLGSDVGALLGAKSLPVGKGRNWAGRGGAGSQVFVV